MVAHGFAPIQSGECAHGASAGERWVDHDFETVAVPLKTEGLVKGMGALALEIGGEGDLVAALFPAHTKRMPHHGLSNALSLILRVDEHILDHPGGRTLVPEVVHDQQGQGAHDSGRRESPHDSR